MDTNLDGSPEAVLDGGVLYLRLPDGGSERQRWWAVELTGQNDLLQFARGLQPAKDVALLIGSDVDPFRVPQRYADRDVPSPAELFPGEPDGGMVSWELNRHGAVTAAEVTLPAPDLGQALKTSVTLRSGSDGSLPDVANLRAESLAKAPVAKILPLSYSLHAACGSDQSIDWDVVESCVADLAADTTVAEWLREHKGIDAVRPVACFPAGS